MGSIGPTGGGRGLQGTPGPMGMVGLPGADGIIGVDGVPGSSVSSSRVKRNSGNFTLNSSTWADVSSATDLTIAAKVGDVLEVLLSALWGNEGVSALLDVTTIVAGVPVNYFGSGPVTSTSGDGIQSWAKENSGSGYTVISGGAQYVVTSGDISAGIVTLRLRYHSGGSITLFASANNVLQFAVKNLGPATATLPGNPLLAASTIVSGAAPSTTSATLSDVDATNAKITFTAPTSGNVLVRVTCPIAISPSNANAFFGLREGTTNLVNGTQGTFVAQSFGASVNYTPLVSWCAIISGISAGSHTYKLAFAINGGATLTVYMINASTTFIMEVWAAP